MRSNSTASYLPVSKKNQPSSTQIQYADDKDIQSDSAALLKDSTNSLSKFGQKLKSCFAGLSFPCCGSEYGNVKGRKQRGNSEELAVLMFPPELSTEEEEQALALQASTVENPSDSDALLLQPVVPTTNVGNLSVSGASSLTASGMYRPAVEYPVKENPSVLISSISSLPG